MISAVSIATAEDRTSRRIVLWSLGLNVFFVCLVAALLVRLYIAPPAAAPIDRSASGRIERIATTLPAADAEIIRAEYRAKAGPVDAARDEFERDIDAIRQTFRAEPYDVGATRAAMAEARAAHQRFNLLLHDIIASAANKMSPAGRQKLADWSPPGRTPPTTTSR
ncbi:MAG TPA: periplasmic heavy metal sensor [Xanthobacteraceae bacterium]|nr:periplasmic heavy metal sensor [Xanthobacteraceae bacterium]